MSEPVPALSLDDVRHVAKLARIALPEARLAPMRDELAAILGHIAHLQRVDVAGLEPMARPLAASNRLRDDVPTEGLSRDLALMNAPAREGDFIAVPKVLGGESS
jgi:aspartyl-tRNA(Asn)/glutamyl-tRNA(Gln) amidotransferase subunit C